MNIRLTAPRSTFSNAFATGALYTMPKGSIIFTIFMNIGLYVLFTIICFVLARPPHDLVKTAIASRLARCSIPGPLRRFITPRQMSKEQAVAVCFCGAAKTSGVGIPLVAAMWADGQDELRRAYLQIPVLLYTMEQVFLAQGLVYLFKWYLRRNVHSDLDVVSAAERGGARGVRDLDGAVGEVGEEEQEGEMVMVVGEKEMKRDEGEESSSASAGAGGQPDLVEEGGKEMGRSASQRPGVVEVPG